MKTIGLLGGMSWESTASYYRLINEGIKQQLGGLHSAKICMVSVDFQEIEKLQHQGNWQATAELLSQSAQAIERGGADGLLICTNTMHKVANQVEASISIPLLHIADATAERLISDGVRRVGLLGTRFTMEQSFYKERLISNYGINVQVPSEPDQDLIHRVIYEELCLGVVNEQSRQGFIEIINRLSKEGCEAVILGCTEIALLVDASLTSVPLYDTTQIHADKAVAWSLS